jgi:hypothetical protein
MLAWEPNHKFRHEEDIRFGVDFRTHALEVIASIPQRTPQFNFLVSPRRKILEENVGDEQRGNQGKQTVQYRHANKEAIVGGPVVEVGARVFIALESPNLSSDTGALEESNSICPLLDLRSQNLYEPPRIRVSARIYHRLASTD